MKKQLKYLIFVVTACAIVFVLWIGLTFLEGENPAIRITPPLAVIGKSTTVSIAAEDTKSGLRSVTVTIAQNGREQVLATRSFPERGHNKETVELDIRPRELKLAEGRASVTVTAVDFSLRKNTETVTLDVPVDTIPPRIQPLWTAHYINSGGTGVVRYRLSDDAVFSGVEVNGILYRGYRTSSDAQPTYTAYFACPILSGRNEVRIGFVAEDKGGNKSFVPISYIIKDKKFRESIIEIDNNFLERKMPEFQERYDAMPTDLVASFVFVNETLRLENDRIVRSVCENSTPRQLWEGTFLRMRDGAPMALFGDSRTYVIGGRSVSTSSHLGIDLASTQNAPVTAMNSGVIAFADYLGIYGNTVIIDHGLGLFSLYGHLSSIETQKGEAVEKGGIIGRTGMTGFAGGDHLHYSIMIGPTFVNPQEWWDPHWIADNVVGLPVQ